MAKSKAVEHGGLIAAVTVKANVTRASARQPSLNLHSGMTASTIRGIEIMAQALRDYRDELDHPTAATPVRWLARDALPERDARALQQSLAEKFAPLAERGNWSMARRLAFIVGASTGLWLAIIAGAGMALA